MHLIFQTNKNKPKAIAMDLVFSQELYNLWKMKVFATGVEQDALAYSLSVPEPGGLQGQVCKVAACLVIKGSHSSPAVLLFGSFCLHRGLGEAAASHAKTLRKHSLRLVGASTWNMCKSWQQSSSQYFYILQVSRNYSN